MKTYKELQESVAIQVKVVKPKKELDITSVTAGNKDIGEIEYSDEKQKKFTFSSNNGSAEKLTGNYNTLVKYIESNSEKLSKLSQNEKLPTENSENLILYKGIKMRLGTPARKTR